MDGPIPNDLDLVSWSLVRNKKKTKAKKVYEERRQVWHFSSYYIILFIHVEYTWYCNSRAGGNRGPRGNPFPPLCVQMDFPWTFQTNNMCNDINHVWSHFYEILVVLKHHRRLWNNIFDTAISRSINIPKNAKYTPLMWVFMHLKMSVSKMLFDRHLWYFRTTKIW